MYSNFKMGSHCVLTGILAAVILTLVSAGCPDGWVSHQGRCYIYLHEQINWFLAQDTCGYLKAKLVELETEEENKYVSELVQSRGVNKAWIGLHDIAEEGYWTWTSNRESPNPTHWANHQPNDQDHMADCAAIQPATALWADYNCQDDTFPYVCEKAGTSPVIG